MRDGGEGITVFFLHSVYIINSMKLLQFGKKNFGTFCFSDDYNYQSFPFFDAGDGNKILLRL